jgi:hypothetical protein
VYLAQLSLRVYSEHDGRHEKTEIHTVFTILPASGHYYYLPWQAAYNKNPVKGYMIDLCKDLDEKKPGVIWFDDKKIWNSYSIEDYEPCVKNFIINNYKEIKKFWYIRNDLEIIEF